MGTGSGQPTPKCYDAAVANGADWEVVVTPAAGEYVVIYSVFVGEDTLGTTTLMQILVGGVVILSEALAAPGVHDTFATLRTPAAFPSGAAVTVRLTATTAGTLLVTAAKV